jgi:hypothetical protein
MLKIKINNITKNDNTNKTFVKKKINRTKSIKDINKEIDLITNKTGNIILHNYKIDNDSSDKDKTESSLNLKNIYNNNDIINSTVVYLNRYLNNEDKQNLSNYMYCITNKLKGDGAGLSSGTLIDMLICEFFQTKLCKCEEYHNGECDIKINDELYSLKKINGKSILALDWSKNNSENKKETFKHNIILINTKKSQWWKNNPKNIIANDNINYTKQINSAIYIIDKDYCKKNIILSSNNKSNSIITEQYVYKMICNSIEQKTFIELPEKNTELKFSLMKCFL